MKKVISLIRKYNVQDKKVETRYNREFSGSCGITPCSDGKSSVLRKMEMKLADLNAEINECAKSMNVRRAEWDEAIEEAGLLLDSWNHKLIFQLVSE